MSVLPAFLCVTCVPGIYRSQKTAKDPRAGIIGGCEPYRWVLGNEPHLQGQQMPLPAELSF